MRFLICALSASASLGGLAAPLAGQTMGLQRVGRFGLAVEAMRAEARWIYHVTQQSTTQPPALVQGQTRFPSGLLFLSSYAALNPAWRLVVEMPMAYATLGAQGQRRRSGALGNPYIGAFVRGLRAEVSVGVRLPIVRDHELATALGADTEFERVAAFQPRTSSVGVVLQSVARNDVDLNTRYAFGCAYALRTGSAYDVAQQPLHCTAGLEPTMTPGFLRLGLRLLARLEFGGDWMDLGQELALFAERSAGAIRPGLNLRTRLNGSPAVIGLSLQFTPNS